MCKINDLTEERFGRLFVIEQCGRSKDRHIDGNVHVTAEISLLFLRGI